MSPVIPSTASLSDTLSVTQARFELHRAMDFGGEVELSAWARKWGEAAIAAGEVSAETSEDDYGCWRRNDHSDLSKALGHAAGIVVALSSDAPEISKLRALAQSQLSRLQAISERLEDGE